MQEAAEVSVSSSFPARIKLKLYSVVHSRGIPEPAASAGVYTHWITNISFQFFTKTVVLAFICFKPQTSSALNGSLTLVRVLRLIWVWQDDDLVWVTLCRHVDLQSHRQQHKVFTLLEKHSEYQQNKNIFKNMLMLLTDVPVCPHHMTNLRWRGNKTHPRWASVFNLC